MLAGCLGRWPASATASSIRSTTRCSTARYPQPRLGHAYSVHGITGSLGWARGAGAAGAAALAFSWRVALCAAAALAFAVLAVLWLNRSGSCSTPPQAAAVHAAAAKREGSSVDFLRIPAVWMCLAFFLFYAMSLSGVQAFAPEAARQLHDVPAHLGGDVPHDLHGVQRRRHGRSAASSSPIRRAASASWPSASAPAALVALAHRLRPCWRRSWCRLLFGAMGFASGIAGPSRDLIVKRSAPDNATGRVYGVVYSGLDIGQAIAPLIFGTLMDMHRPAAVWLGLAIVQGVIVTTAFNVRKVRRTVFAPA